jgi:hypothetical protein
MVAQSLTLNVGSCPVIKTRQRNHVRNLSLFNTVHTVGEKTLRPSSLRYRAGWPSLPRSLRRLGQLGDYAGGSDNLVWTDWARTILYSAKRSSRSNVSGYLAASNSSAAA